MSRYIIPDNSQDMSDEELEQFYNKLIFDSAPNGFVRETYNGEKTVWTVCGPNGHVLHRYERYDHEPYIRELE